ncbi:pimeloyl-ACP methyl ester carboxylesterase [Streptomyces sp. Amel2xB2]|uniref:alpha/beta hydrolase n=1 Tax=Streptomyces sp. Amel2xB2 TaxID=1305829 RepID=UPI000DBA0756|nr:alpha/beta hydrolase [Streptomyces sp. Amel2xB2]RAJ69100.1 pimeloyl-ACP methyl ester carboxylesterase [Streptomyces sp. Amel2xB2]
MGAITYEELRVPVRGGHLTVLRWPATVRPPEQSAGPAPTVVALHGITSNALSWAGVAHHLAGRVTLVAPDLRGRAGSNALPGPYGMAAHAEDATALTEALGLRDVVLAGHSMGAFVAAVAGVRHPERFRSLLLVDGGVGFPVPEGLNTDDLITAVIGPAMERLKTTFPDRDAYRAFWQNHPAFTRSWEPWTEAHILRDLTGTEPELRSSCLLDAVREDGADTLSSETARALHRLTVPGELLWAERGLLDEPQGLYDEQRLKSAAVDDTTIRSRKVPGSNHYTLLLGDEGASTVAQSLLAATGAERPPAD